MKKFIKIFLLVLFIILFLGITTSEAKLTVNSSTTASKMIEELNKSDGYLTGISNIVRRANPYLYCREKNQAINSSAKYQLTGKVSYPGDDSVNGHAKAYILAADGYGDNTSNGLRQYAWWYILGKNYDDEGNAGLAGNNELVDIAKAYQNYKKSEKLFSVNYEKKAITSDGFLIYGPIKVNYSYGYIKSGSYSDEWGGFDYAFFNGDTKITAGIELCSFNNGEYTPIKTTGTNGNYNKVRTNDYCYNSNDKNTELYVKVNLSEIIYINGINLKIKENKVDYKAEVYNIEGKYKVNTTRYVYCSVCEASAISYSKDLYKSLTNTGRIVEYGDRYYKYTGKYYNYFTTQSTSVYHFGNTMEYSSEINDVEAGYYVLVKNNKIEYITKSQQDVYDEYYENYTTNSVCNICNPTYVIIPKTKAQAISHGIAKNHIMGPMSLSKAAGYNFEEYLGCGCRTKVVSGSTYNSQNLFVVNPDKTKNNTECEIKNIQIPLKTSIEIEKKWEDFDNKYNVRPNDISIKVYRCNSETNWEELTKGTDYNITNWTKNGNTWTATISDLRMTDDNGNMYYFKVVEQAQNYYNETYSSESIKADVPNKKITITNKLKEAKIDITKQWADHSNIYEIRPTAIKFNVFRSTDNQNWEKLTENTHYKVKWKTTEGDTWAATISELLGVNESGKEYYFKVEEQALVYYDPTYPQGKVVKYEQANNLNKQIAILNGVKKVNIGGYVWLDGQTGIKPAEPYNGIKDVNEKGMENIVVYLYYKNPETGAVIKKAETKTDANGYYEFKEYEIGYYYVEFEYDGVHYEDTISVENGSSKAFETDGNRNTFNNRFTTITYGKSNDGTTLKYNYANNKSTLITTGENGKVKQEFVMNAASKQELYKTDTSNINLGLVKRGTDIALSTDVRSAQVYVNGQTTDYKFNKEDNNIEIGNTQTSDDVSYNLNLYASDYNYRIRNYVSSSTFKENSYINEEAPEGVKTGDELDVCVIYELNLQNQGTETTKINEVKYTFDEKYDLDFIPEAEGITVSGNIITLNFDSLSLKEGETKTLSLIFHVNNNDGLVLGNFSNKAEITSYSTEKGLIDVDSEPGNFINDKRVEDDNDTAGGLTIKIAEEDTVRKITGKVFNSDNNQNVNDVIVQLIEVKTVNNKVYEYIWQETVSGTGKGLRLNADGTALEEYTYTKTDGTYEFNGFIPGDYIVRFIYGDGTTYDMTGNVIKYNGQDYKSAEDSNYNSEWYNSSSYTQGASVARDNEARRLETMTYSVNIDASKGVLLKLLNNVTVDTLNETEKEVLISTYNNLYDPDITEVTTEVINKLLKEQVLKNTWMCAETSKIKVAVDTENITNTNTLITVDGTKGEYLEEIQNINLGLKLRPATKIELEKYITGFKLIAANGQTLVNAYIDINEYLNNPTDISNKVQGIRDNVTILDTVWQYEVAPTDINTIVDGASLEFEYTLVVKNTGETDYLSAELADAYNNRSTTDYITTLANKAKEMKSYMKAGTYSGQIGKYVGKSYYVGGTGASKVLTEVTNIRDYINNDLKFISRGGDVAIDENAPHTYRILRDDYTMQEATINTVLKTTKTTGKMENDGTAVIYKITLGKNPISATGNLNFENYIAEVMSFTNAVGRRAMVSTPGNAEIIDHEHREGKTHELDEADTARIQVGVATGEDGKTNYIIITAVIAGIAIIAAGAFVVKKYVIK